MTVLLPTMLVISIVLVILALWTVYKVNKARNELLDFIIKHRKITYTFENGTWVGRKCAEYIEP